MRRIIKLSLAIILGVCNADAAVRDANTIHRGDTSTNTQRTITNTRNEGTAARATVQRKLQRTTKPVNTNRQNTVSARTATPASVTTRTTPSNSRLRTQQNKTAIRLSSNPQNTKNTARATITLNTTQSNTFGTGYNTRRDAYFTCMDQFCGAGSEG